MPHVDKRMFHEEALVPVRVGGVMPVTVAAVLFVSAKNATRPKGVRVNACEAGVSAREPGTPVPMRVTGDP